jgi:sec-independent protein translocase protein TatA
MPLRVAERTGASALMVIRSGPFRSTFARMPSIGPLELGIVLLIVLIVFGPKRLPGLGRQLGSGMREFKDSVSGVTKHDDPPTQLPPGIEDTTPAPTRENETVL